MKTNRVILIAAALIVVAAIIAVIIAVNRGGDSDDESSGNSASISAQQKAETPEDVRVVSQPMLTMGVGEQCAVSAANGDSFSCDRANVLEVDSASGLMTAKSEGWAIVTKQSSGNTEKYYVTVKKAPQKVAFPVSELKLQKGETTSLTLIPTAKDEGFQFGALSSGDSDVVSISDNGEITAVCEGSATVTGTAFNGQKAEINVTVLDNSGYTDISTIYPTALQKEAGWNFPTVTDVPEGSSVQQYGQSDDGRWLHVKYGDDHGWIYNRAIEDKTNYDDFTLETLPVMADDLLFEIGRDKRDIFDFVYAISYGTEEDDTDENLCVQYFRTQKGACFIHGAMLCYLYNRCGYETLRVVGISALDHVNEHSWCLSKTENGWKHVDAQFFSIRDADDQFFIDDYSYFFNWDKDKAPAMEVSSQPTGQSDIQPDDQADGQDEEQYDE